MGICVGVFHSVQCERLHIILYNICFIGLGLDVGQCEHIFSLGYNAPCTDRVINYM